MNIEIGRLIFDFGMLVLIWIVQLVIYPSFKFYQKQDLMQWHKKYVIKIAYVVMPLMIGQLSLGIVDAFTTFSLYYIIVLILIVLVWISTFFQFLPMHNSISFGETNAEMLDQLIHKNWLRTVLLTLVFFLNLFQYMSLI